MSVYAVNTRRKGQYSPHRIWKWRRMEMLCIPRFSIGWSHFRPAAVEEIFR